MNERVKELMEQAQDWVDQRVPFASEEREWFAEKFAELIVRECARQVNCYEALNIFEHFGVEE